MINSFARPDCCNQQMPPKWRGTTESGKSQLSLLNRSQVATCIQPLPAKPYSLPFRDRGVAYEIEKTKTKRSVL